MSTHSSLLAFRIPRHRGSLAGYHPRVHKKSDGGAYSLTQHSAQGLSPLVILLIDFLPLLINVYLDHDEVTPGASQVS